MSNGTERDIDVAVDKDKCCGYGDCVLVAPDLFELDDDGVARVIPGARPTADTVREAADSCPVAAIMVGST